MIAVLVVLGAAGLMAAPGNSEADTMGRQTIATAAERDALVRFVRAMSRGLITQVVRVDTAPLRFATSHQYVEVSVAESMQSTER
jgi:hypothetical protein